MPDNATLEPLTLTVEAFVRATSPGTFLYILSKGGGPTSATNASYAFYTGSTGGLTFYTRADGGATYLSDAAPASMWDGNWHHIAGTFDGDEVRLFVDGAEVGTANAAAIGYNTPFHGDLAVGALHPNSTLGFTGAIDEVRVWASVLTLAEIQARAGRGGP